MCSLFVAVFIVEFAPDALRRVLEPVVRLLASVPSVIYGLVGVFVLVPLIGNHLITQGSKASVQGIITLNGYSLLAGVAILTVMVAPVMVAIFSDGLRAVPRGWIEASLGLGINKWRTVWKIGVRTARPAIVAGTVLATARALGEAVMLSMVCGVVSFAPNPADGWIFFVEPTRPLADPGLTVGHVHLHVGDIERGLQFYRDVLGFEVMTQLPTASFLAMDGYHHHVAINVWRGVGVPPAPPATVGLRHWTIVFETPEALAAALARIERAGIPTEHRDDGVLVRDPWEIALLLTVRDHH